MGIPLNCIMYEPGASGVPSTAVPLPDLKDRIDSYSHTISDRFGFESCTLALHVSYDEAQDWLASGLMRSLVVSGPDLETVWEGYLETITVTMGQKKASISLAGMANSVYFLWTTIKGSPGNTVSLATTASTLSQSLYGRKDYLGSLPKVLPATVTAACAKTLAALCLPRSAQPSSAMTGALGEITLELSFAGWYASLDWILGERSSALNTATNTQISGFYLPNYQAFNPFFSTDYSGITFTGPLMPEEITRYVTHRQIIERLLSVGDSSNNPLAWGVYEDRGFDAVVNASATPSVMTYYEDAATGLVGDAYGAEVKPWNVRPNAMSQIQQFVPVGPTPGAIDTTSTRYIARTTCLIQGDTIGCTLEPGGAGDLDALTAAFPPIFFWRG